MRVVALLRGINLGPNKRIAMEGLRSIAESLGHSDVETYLQSGNVVFTPKGRAKDIGPALSAAILDATGHDIAVVTREQAATTRRSLFGFAVPDFPFFKRKQGDEELREIKTTIVSTRQFGPNQHRIQVAEANGVWETLESLRREPEAGQPVHITRGALGSYWLKVGNQREVRARRVR